MKTNELENLLATHEDAIKGTDILHAPYPDFLDSR